MTLLATRGLAVTIGGRGICQALDLTVAPGECWCVLGANGAGKTTLLHTLAGLHAPAAGTIEVAQRGLALWPRRALAQQVGVLPQDSLDPFPATVLETALIGRHPWLRAWQWESREDERRARRALADAGLTGFEGRDVGTLSGGERRRLAFATLLTQAPRLYLLDEPSNHLDLPHQVRLLELLCARAREQGGAVVMTLHDVNLADRFADHVLLLHGDGRHDLGRREAVLDETHLTRLYGYPVRCLSADGRRAFLPA
ncbi:ABC transporter ATP-binding protein [Spiribacter halobius]|uniref:ABC transporter n=1 Tax=Sediminicurvatus halobius TaxID=2182432 RepID=A0A2U2N267_9GAMM|nr:ABC transporter ATP-binding protein [Spiribacter halobius]PWG63148.1 ABC transporter [Spiribacter halobius]UEX77597.1 ABC transporter ATP-binding protein [Spiribacter halobius]